MFLMLPIGLCTKTLQPVLFWTVLPSPASSPCGQVLLLWSNESLMCKHARERPCPRSRGILHCPDMLDNTRLSVLKFSCICPMYVYVVLIITPSELIIIKARTSGRDWCVHVYLHRVQSKMDGLRSTADLEWRSEKSHGGHTYNHITG